MPDTSGDLSSSQTTEIERNNADAGSRSVDLIQFSPSALKRMNFDNVKKDPTYKAPSYVSQRSKSHDRSSLGKSGSKLPIRTAYNLRPRLNCGPRKHEDDIISTKRPRIESHVTAGPTPGTVCKEIGLHFPIMGQGDNQVIK